MLAHDDPALGHHIEQQFVGICRGMVRGKQVTEGPGWWRLLTGHPHPLGNFVFFERADRTRVPRDVLQPLMDIGQPAAVFVPGSPPSELDDDLAEAGFAIAERTPVMARDLADWTPPAARSDLEIRAISLDPEATAWSEALAEGYEIPLPIASLFGHANVVNTDPPLRVRHFGAFEDGRIIATSMSYLDGTLGGIYCVAVRPEARRRGLGRALTCLAIAEIQRGGYPTAILQSSAMGEPVYRSLGFVQCGQITLYVHLPSPTA